MIQPEQEEKKKGILDRLPKLGRISQLVLFIGIFLIIFIPLFLINQQQGPKQAELETTLANLTKIVAIGQTPQAKYEAELEQVKAETEAAKATFPSINQSPEIIDSLLELAESNEIYVVQTKVSTTKPDPKAKDKPIGPTLTIELGMKSQVCNFQNFLLALDDVLPSSQIKEVDISGG